VGQLGPELDSQLIATAVPANELGMRQRGSTELMLLNASHAELPTTADKPTTRCVLHSQARTAALVHTPYH
jgi:hypothetical protein